MHRSQFSFQASYSKPRGKAVRSDILKVKRPNLYSSLTQRQAALSTGRWNRVKMLGQLGALDDMMTHHREAHCMSSAAGQTL
jgi:hypothetical protein